MSKFFDHRFVEAMVAQQAHTVKTVIADKVQNTSGRQGEARLACTLYISRPVNAGGWLSVAVSVAR